jgi:hypothetical protein
MGGSLYVHPFGPLPQVRGRGTVKSGRRRVKVCPRRKGRRRVQRTGSRTVHRAARRVRHGRQAAARYQEDSDGTP